MWHLQSVLRIGLVICVIRKAQSCYDIVEKGKATEFTCTVPNNFIIITWQTLTDTNALDLTTCNMVTSVCTDQLPSVYHGRVLSSVPGTYTVELSIKSARINETWFRCLIDGDATTDECELEVYKWPSIPTSGGIRLTHQYVDVTFLTVAYPAVRAVLHRRKIDVTDDDADSSHCSRYPSSSDPNSDYIIACTWRIPVAKMLLSNTFYVEMSAFVANPTLVNRLPVVSNDVVQQIGAVTVSLNNCPQEIRKDTFATCTCTTSASGFFSPQARWFTADEKVVGEEDSSHRSSTLIVSFNPSDPNPTYECRGINPTREYPYITYEPKFSSSAPGCAITWILFLLAVCTGLSSTLL